MAEEAVKNGSGAGDAQVVDDGLQDKIIRQVEYYFGDINLMKDNFLKEKIQEDNGWVTLETMLKFNRLKALSDDCKVICDALRKSDRGLVEVTEENDKIRRNPEKPLPGDSKEHREEVTARSVYVKVFPEDSKLDVLMSFFESYGAVENIFMRRDFRKKNFKGSVFVTYAKKEEAEKFMNEEGTKFNDAELVKKYKANYYAEKLEERKNKKGGNKEDKKDADTKEETEEEVEERVKQQMTKNSVLHLKGMDPETTREDIKNFFEDISPVGWVDFDSGVTEGYLRLREPNSAEPALEKAKEQGDGKIVIKDKELEVRAVQGDEELEYWKKMFKEISSRNSRKKTSGFGNRGGGRGGGRGGRRGGGRGGHQGKRRYDNRNRDGDEPSRKAAKAE